jgi:hypothetical protein
MQQRAVVNQFPLLRVGLQLNMEWSTPEAVTRSTFNDAMTNPEHLAALNPPTRSHQISALRAGRVAYTDDGARRIVREGTAAP